MAEGGSREPGPAGMGHLLHPSLWSQTMNYVGQLAETVFVTVKELYRGLNPATLTGGIDVIVVRQPDGSFQCSPFHVRFGKLGVLRSKEKVVDIEINGEPVHLQMKLGDNGEAFFVEEHEDMESRVPAHLCTSPLPMEVPSEPEEAPEEPAPSSGTAATRRKKRRRKRIRSDTHLWEEGTSSSEEREREREKGREHSEQESPVKEDTTMLMINSKSVYYSMSEDPYEERGAAQTSEVIHPHSEGECSPSESNVFYSRPPSPKSDSELLVKPQESLGPQMQWNWGGFPKMCQTERSPLEVPRYSPIHKSQSSHFRTIRRQESFDLDQEATVTCVRAGSVTVVRPQPGAHSLDLDLEVPSVQTTPLALEKAPHVATSTPNQPSQPHSLAFLAMASVDSHQAQGPQSRTPQVGVKSADGPSPNLEPEEHRNSNTTDVVCPFSKDGLTNTVKMYAAQTPSRRSSKASVIINDRSASKSTNSLATATTLVNTATMSNTAIPAIESLSSIENSQSALPEPSEQVNGVSPGEGDSGIDPHCSEGGEEDNGPVVSDSTTKGSPTNQTAEKVGVIDVGAIEAEGEEPSGAAEAGSKSEQQDKSKGKRSQHLGPADIYLDDLNNLEPDVAALYFPKSESDAASRVGAEPGSLSRDQSPQSVGSGAMDSGTEYLSDSTTDHLEVSMSLCGCVGDTSQTNKDEFTKHLVTYQDLVKNPGIIEDPNLVICINSQYYNWAVAAPMVLSMQAFQKNLPKSTIEQLVKDKMPKKSGRWWFSWRRKEMDTKQQKNHKQKPEEAQAEESTSASLTAASAMAAPLDDVTSDEEVELNRKSSLSQSLSSETISTALCLTQMYRKSLRLTSEQIESLNLREGANKVVFSVTTQYQGTCRCEAAIYLWCWDDSVIISDIDGTITKSDALGHILPQLGKDWTHQGIAKLYHKIHQNGYKFLYCSARAIGMADITKGYLQWVNDKGIVLPKGPVLLAPSSLFSALHREVIEKKPEVFKIACLTDIRELFNPRRQPFYAAFGNRTNDAYAYKQVGVSDSRIFTVNPKGELIQERTKGNKSSYTHLSELVEHFFPVICGKSSSSASFDCPEYSHFVYWRDPLPQLELDSLI
ncbi:phosphatidate phosphatase LPIN2 [Aplochiton taeniatus]